jgi:hypothetical protein
MLTQLLPRLEAPSVVAMNNAPYHRRNFQHSWKRDEIIAWQQEKGFPFEKGSFKPNY